MGKKGAFLLLCGLLAVSLFLGGCGKKESLDKHVPLVKIVKVSADSASGAAVYAGSVHGRYETVMSFQVSGRILQRNVQLGDRVRAGDVLMAIDARDVVQRVNSSEAAVQSARAQMELADKNLGRYEELYAQDAVPASVRDQYRTNYDSAVAAYEQASAQAAEANNSMGYTALTAAADGVISAISAESGQVVLAGAPVLTLVQDNEMEIEIAVPENRLSDVPIGRAVEVSFWAGGNEKTRGLVREVAPMADSNARTYKVRVSLPEPPADMRLGMTASVSCQDSSLAEGIYVLPLTAIYQTGEDSQVWLVGADNTVSLQDVAVESFGADSVMVRGLSSDAVVVTAGVHKLHEGQEVRLPEGDGA